MATFTTFTYMLYQKNGDFVTGNISPLFGFKTVTTADLDLVEITGGAGSINTTLEAGERYSESGFTGDFEYRGFVDTAGDAGRLYIFETVTGPFAGDVIVTSLNDTLANDAAGQAAFPDVIQATSIDDSSVVFCFMQGTRIATTRGDVAVEDLRIGDPLKTADGRTVAVKWIGIQRIAFPALMHGGLEPVCVSAGALGASVPYRDLYVSADHGLILNDYAVTASALVNGDTIRFAPTSDPFTYYHIETEDHDVILANGVPAETFADVASRTSFDNYHEYADLYGYERTIRESPYPRISTKRLLPIELKQGLPCFERVERTQQTVANR